MMILFFVTNSTGQSDSAGVNKSDSLIPPSSVELEVLNDTMPREGFINNILQFFKFKKNRDSKEKQRVNAFLEEQIKDSNLIVTKSADEKTQFYRPDIELMAWYGSDWNPMILEGHEDYFSSINILAMSLKDIGQLSEMADVVKNQMGAFYKKARDYDGDFYLTIYCSDEQEISEFLNNSGAQNDFFEELLEFISAVGVEGLLFDLMMVRPEDTVQITNFFYTLSQRLNSEFNQKLILSIPTIVSESSLSTARGYDFSALNPIMDYYLIRPRQLTNRPASNFERDDDLKIIQSTVDYYLNKNVPVSKLMVNYSLPEEKSAVKLRQRFAFGDDANIGGIVLMMPTGQKVDQSIWEEISNFKIEKDTIIVDKKLQPRRNIAYSLKKFGKELDLFFLAALVLLVSNGFVLLSRSDR